MEKKVLLDMITLLVIHYFGDFLFQTSKMAERKSKNVYWLLTHVFVYSIYVFVGSIQIFGLNNFLILYVFINAVCHFITDYITSKWTDKYHTEGNMNMFYKVLGFDQLVHIATLVISYHFVTKLILIS